MSEGMPADLWEARYADLRIRLEALANHSDAAAKAIISLRADQSRLTDLVSALADRVLDVERQVAAVQALLRPRSVE